MVATLAEMARPTSLLLASTRPFLTALQGVWWIQTAYIMYRGELQSTSDPICLK